VKRIKLKEETESVLDILGEENAHEVVIVNVVKQSVGLMRDFMNLSLRVQRSNLLDW
jgi:nitrogen regulatory protein PII-like uncharacterized protein